MDAINKENKKGKRSTFAILFYINRTKIRKDGLCQLLCNISIDAESEQVGTKVSVDPSLWDSAEGRAAGRSHNALQVNKAIDLLTKRINNHHKEIKESLGFVTAELVKNALKGVAQKPLTLMKLFEEHNNEFKKRVGVDRKKEAHDQYVVSYNHLLAFIRKKYDTDDVKLRSLDFHFYEDYDLFLRTDRELQQKTVHQHLYNLKKITKRAFNQGTLRRDPYMKLFPELPPLKSRHLKLEDLEKLMQCTLDRSNLRRARDMFVFSTFTGLCHADLTNLSDEHIIQAADGSLWIHIKRQKTGTDSHVRLLEIPLKIMEKYRPERSSKRIFKVYDRSYMGKLLKEIAEICGINHISFHRARHNFGTHITLSQGVPIETVSRMMGHKNISTTQIYAKVTDRKVDEDMKRLRLRTASKSKKVTLYEDESLRAAIRYPKAKMAKKQCSTINKMNTTSILIEKGRVTIRPVAGGVWLTQHEIADIFSMFISAINTNIRSILKNGILQEDEVCRHKETKTGILALYNLEMITALAFRLKSRRAQYFREWITGQALNPVILWKILGMNTMLN